jgi:hypothetical protein
MADDTDVLAPNPTPTGVMDTPVPSSLTPTAVPPTTPGNQPPVDPGTGDPLTTIIPTQTTPPYQDPEMVMGAAHQGWLGKILDDVGSILGGDKTLHVTKHPDGSVEVTHDPSTGAEKWGRVAAAALGGAAKGMAVGQGPGGPARAASAGIESGLKQPQEALDRANEEASIEQKQMQAHANLVLTQQQSVGQTLQNKLSNIKVTQEQIDQSNDEQERLANAPGSEEIGTYGSMAEAAKSPNAALILKHHPGGTMRTVPVFDGDHNIVGVKAYAIDKAWADRVNDQPITYLRAKASPTAGGDPTFEKVVIPAGAHKNSEIDTILNTQNAENLKINADVAKAKETAKKDDAEAPLKTAQTAEANARASEATANAAKARAGTKLLEGGAGAAAAAGAGLHGEEYLQEAVDPAMHNQIRATAAGNIKIPTATRSPANQAFRNAVLNYDPTFTDSRYDTIQNFKTKGDAQNLVQLSTAMEHLERATKNSSYIPLSPTATAYEQDIKNFTQESGKLIKNGVLTQGEYEDLKGKMSGMDSPIPAYRKKALAETTELLGGKVRGVFQKYKTGTGQDLPVEKYFDQPTQERLTRFGVTPTAAQPAAQPAAAPAAAQPGAATQPPAYPVLGDGKGNYIQYNGKAYVSVPAPK